MLRCVNTLWNRMRRPAEALFDFLVQRRFYELRDVRRRVSSSALYDDEVYDAASLPL